jgi:hypothetical protein
MMLGRVRTELKEEKPKFRVAQPSDFDGTAHTYRDWLRSVDLYIRGMKIRGTEDKILVTLSYMKKGTAARWAHFYFDKMDEETSEEDWVDFRIQLDAAFLDKNIQRRSREKLEKFRQGVHKVDEFMNQFELLLADTGVTTGGESLRLLENTARVDLIDTIYHSGEIPIDYAAYCSQVLSLFLSGMKPSFWVTFLIWLGDLPFMAG